MMQCSLQDLIGIYMPYMVLLAVQVISSSFIYDPTLRLLLYAVLPESLKTWPWFGLCFIEEVHFWTMLVSIGTPGQLQVISFELINKSLETIIASVTLKQYVIPLRKKLHLVNYVSCIL